jgi:hypothetical protein
MCVCVCVRERENGFKLWKILLLHVSKDDDYIKP